MEFIVIKIKADLILAQQQEDVSSPLVHISTENIIPLN